MSIATTVPQSVAVRGAASFIAVLRRCARRPGQREGDTQQKKHACFVLAHAWGAARASCGPTAPHSVAAQRTSPRSRGRLSRRTYWALPTLAAASVDGSLGLFKAAATDLWWPRLTVPRIGWPLEGKLPQDARRTEGLGRCDKNETPFTGVLRLARVHAGRHGRFTRRRPTSRCAQA